MEQQPVPTSSNALNHSEVAPQNTDALETGYESLAKKNKSGYQTLDILVDGVTCALCIQKIESALTQKKDVKNAHINFSSGRLSIEWDGPASWANDFVLTVEDLGYGTHPYDERSAAAASQSEERFLLLCLGVAGFAMGNIMLLSVSVWSTTTETMGIGTRDLLHWISALIALPTILFSGRPFFRSALKALSHGQTNMDVPISIAILLAGGMSVFETFNHGEHVYFDSAVMLMFFLLIGRYLDFKARENARSSAADLLSSFQGFATVLEGSHTKRVLIRDLKEGMTVRVAAGESFPVDGTIQEGQSTVDTSLITGETLPRDIGPEQNVHAGTLNIAAPVTMQVSKVAKDSLLSDIVRLMDKAGQTQSAYVRIADKAAKLYTPVVHTMALLAFLGWLIIGQMPWQDALMIGVTVLIITCPCALGLAVPVVQVLATGLLMKRGVFVKSGDAFERLATIDTALFDKTGTLTQGRLRLLDHKDEKTLQLAASLAAHSQHPLSKALCEAFDGPLLKIDHVQELEGKGLRGDYNGQSLQLGSRNWCGDHKAPATESIELWLKIDDQSYHCFYFEDSLRPDVPEMVQSFEREDIRCALISGDRQAVVEKIASDSGIDEFYFEQNPLQKYEILESLQNKQHKALMVGDGLNDAPVLTGAHVSIAPGTAIDMAQNAADIIFMGEKIAPVFLSYKIAKQTQKLVKQNFTLAVMYNFIAIPLAVMGFVTPFLAAIAMSASSLLVISNSFRIKLTA